MEHMSKFTYFDRAYLDSIFGHGRRRRPDGKGKPATRSWRLLGVKDKPPVVLARTKSEARAAFKRMLGCKGRLALGMAVVEVTK